MKFFQEVLRRRLPKKGPITALRLTVELLDGYFQQESAFHGFDYTNASVVFERNLQTWLQVQKLSKRV